MSVFEPFLLLFGSLGVQSAAVWGATPARWEQVGVWLDWAADGAVTPTCSGLSGCRGIVIIIIIIIIIHPHCGRCERYAQVADDLRRSFHIYVTHKRISQSVSAWHWNAGVADRRPTDTPAAWLFVKTSPGRLSLKLLVSWRKTLSLFLSFPCFHSAVSINGWSLVFQDDFFFLTATCGCWIFGFKSHILKMHVSP